MKRHEKAKQIAGDILTVIGLLTIYLIYVSAKFIEGKL